MTLPVYLGPVTPRQREALVHAANGHTAAAAARLMGTSLNTVNGQLQAVYRKLGANDRTHAVALALVRGLIRADEIRLPAPSGHTGEAA